MSIRLRTMWDVRAFSVTLTAAVVLSSLVLQHLLLPPEIAHQVRWPVALIAFTLAAPLTYFSGLRMYDIHRLSVDMKEAARLDPLTGLLTRYAFANKVCRLAQFPGVIIMADIDNFKQYNDMHGHAMGDAALKHVALIFRSFCRAEDLAGRYGGEEFMIFLPDTDREDGVSVAERLRQKLASSPVEHGDQSLLVTASFGVAVLDHEVGFEEAIARADAALYASKHQGRNRVSAAP